MNKRKHKLERIIRFEYTLFNTLCYPKGKSLIILQHIANLLYFKVWYLYDIGNISDGEKNFMINCNNVYYLYYHNYIDRIY
jgi:hypothetical protein